MILSAFTISLPSLAILDGGYAGRPREETRTVTFALVRRSSWEQDGLVRFSPTLVVGEKHGIEEERARQEYEGKDGKERFKTP